LPALLRVVLGALHGLSVVAPRLAVHLAEVLWTSPRRHERPRWESDLLARGEPLVVPFGLGGLRAWSWGQGPVVLLVHGWEGRGAQLGALVDPLVAAGYRVVAYDAPGHGDSPGRRASIVSFSDALLAAARTVGPVDTIVSHSLGAAATTLALAGGLQARRVAYVAPVDGGKGARRFAAFMGMSATAQDRLLARVEQRFGLPLEDFTAQELGPRLQVPLLVVHDRWDRVVPFADGEGLARWSPRAELEPVEGLGHMRILRDPQVVARVVDHVGPNAGA